MIATPISAAEVARCQASPGPLGPAFTQVAVVCGDRAVTINVGGVQPGDVLLFSHSSATNRFKNPVYHDQSFLFGPEAARWTHCALIDENLTV